MKKIIALVSLILCTGTLSFTSCSQYADMDESIPVNPVISPIKALIAEDGPELVSAEISDINKTVKLSLKNVESLEAVKIRISFSSRAKLVSPTDTILTLDLRQPYKIVVNNLFEDLTYTLTVNVQYKVPKTNFIEYRLENDGATLEGNINYLWNGGYMTTVGDYESIWYANYLCADAFTIDMGSYYKLARFNANLYWAYTNVCPKKYQLWGYTKEGVPPANGNWNDWTLIGDLNNSGNTAANFADGDNLYINEEVAPYIRYVRVKYLENYRTPSSTVCSLCEISFWAYRTNL